MAGSNAQHVRFSKTRHAMPLTMRAQFGREDVGAVAIATGDALRFLAAPMLITARQSALGGSIGHVVSTCSEEEMIATHAGGIVAAVADVQTDGDGTVLDDESHTVGKISPLVEPNNAVAELVALASPEPTVARLVNAGPEEGNLGWGKIREHCEPPTRDVTPRAVSAAPGHFVSPIVPLSDSNRALTLVKGREA